MERVSLLELLAATGGDPVGFLDRDVGFDAVGIDSRTIRAGELFWAVRGDRHDGHDFVPDAFHAGAAACVVQADRTLTANGPKIVVSNTLDALRNFAHWYRDCRQALIVGVTGSVGKTTTREMIHATLSAGFSGIRSPGNLNNRFGLLLSVLEIEDEHEFAVLEMGASQVGEIGDLARIAAPEVGVVTGIGLAHLEGFGGERAIIEAKGELVAALPTSGFAVLPGDDPRARQLSVRAECPVVFVGTDESNDLQATEIKAANDSVGFRADGQAYQIQATGRHHVNAALFAIAIAREIGMPSETIAEGLRSFVAVAGRCRAEGIGPWTVIDDTYNSNPTSMRAACEVLREWDGQAKKLLITGDMLELGNRADELHWELGCSAGDAGVDQLMAYGKHARQVIRGACAAGMGAHRLAECENFDALLAVLDCWLEPGDVVLVKGSRGMRMERVIGWLRTQAENRFQKHTSREQTRAVA